MTAALAHCDIPQEVTSRLEAAKLKTVKDVLFAPIPLLYEAGQLSWSEAFLLNGVVSSKVAPEGITALQLESNSQGSFLPTDMHSLDRALHGGIPCGVITEIVGPSGLGKTQFCHSMVVNNYVKTKGHAVYIDTENSFSAERLIEIARKRVPNLFKSDEELLQLVSSVHVSTPASCDDLIAYLNQLDTFMIEKGVTLLILDSVASLVRREFVSRVDLPGRQDVLASQATQLKFLGEQLNVPVLVTNHITPVRSRVVPAGMPSASGGVEGGQDQGYEYGVSAALGNTWSHCVNLRIALEETQPHPEKPQRQLRLAKSPITHNLSVPYLISHKGFIQDRHRTIADPGTQDAQFIAPRVTIMRN